MDDLKTLAANSLALAIVIFALFMAFGAPVLNGFVDLMRALGAN